MTVSRNEIRVVLVDDHALLRAGLTSLLNDATGITVVGEAADGDQAVTVVQATAPDVVLMDLSMPGTDGVTATAQLTEHTPQAAVVVLTSFVDTEKVQGALAAGAVGYLLKDSEPQEIISAIRAAAQGQSPLHPKAARALIRSTAVGVTAHRAPQSTELTASLTAREREVLDLLSQGLANKQIAKKLAISERTVKSHLTRIYSELDVTDRTAAILQVHGHRATTC